jgi:4'-phosphopantetheinyl transferase
MMQRYPDSTRAVEVVTKRLDVEPDAVGLLERSLSDPERERASRLTHARDRRRFIVARAWLRGLLSERLGIRPDVVELVYGLHGKPALSSRFAHAALCFNVSHAEDIAVYAFSHRREIGVDVEAVRELHDADAVAQRFFSRREVEEYAALGSPDRPLGFFNCWTRKEAFVKAIGDGLQYPLDRFDVSLAPGRRAEILRVRETPGSRCGWHLDAFSPAPGFVAAVVVEDR